jgi:hypothetical protein
VAALKANESELSEAGNIQEDDQRPPQTIQDAIYLVASIRAEISGADTICIVQDDQDDKMPKSWQWIAHTRVPSSR